MSHVTCKYECVLISYCSWHTTRSWQIDESRHIHVWICRSHVLLLTTYVTFVKDIWVTFMYAYVGVMSYYSPHKLRSQQIYESRHIHVWMNLYESRRTAHCLSHVRDKCMSHVTFIYECVCVMSYCSLHKPRSWQMYESRHMYVWMCMSHVLLLIAHATFVTDVVRAARAFAAAVWKTISFVAPGALQCASQRVLQCVLQRRQAVCGRRGPTLPISDYPSSFVSHSEREKAVAVEGIWGGCD